VRRDGKITFVNRIRQEGLVKELADLDRKRLS